VVPNCPPQDQLPLYENSIKTTFCVALDKAEKLRGLTVQQRRAVTGYRSPVSVCWFVIGLLASVRFGANAFIVTE